MAHFITANYRNIMTLTFLTFILLGLYSCYTDIKTRESEEAWKNINHSNDYFLFQEFLNKYPESKRFDIVLKNLIEYRQSYFDSVGMLWHCRQNCLRILVNEKGQILFEDTITELKSIKQLSYSYITNKKNKEFLPEKTYVEGNNNKIYSKGYFVIYAPDLNKDDILRKLIIEIRQGILIYQQDLAKEWYGKNIENLTSVERNLLDSLFLNRVTVFQNREGLLPPPIPSPANFDKILIPDTIETEIKIKNEP